MQKLILSIVRFYQRWISAALPPRCRFIPTCSSYAIEAIEEQGTVKGLWLGMRRVCKCHPLHAGGYDPVPLSKSCAAQSPSSTKEQGI